MYEPVSATHARVTPEMDGPRVPATRGPPPQRPGDPAVTLVLAEERDRIAAGMNDVVVRRLFSAGLSLQTALGLMDGHPAAGKVQEAIVELDLAIRDFRTALFDHHRPGSPPRQLG
jgi:Histidine kinase